MNLILPDQTADLVQLCLLNQHGHSQEAQSDAQQDQGLYTKQNQSHVSHYIQFKQTGSRKIQREPAEINQAECKQRHIQKVTGFEFPEPRKRFIQTRAKQ